MYHLTIVERKKGIMLCYLKLCSTIAVSLLLSILIIHFVNVSALVSFSLSISLGIIFGHATGLQHEFSHGILSRRQLNYWFGIMIGLPLTIAFTEYRLEHMRHHMFLGTPKNNEVFVKRDVESLNVLTLISNILMFPHHVNTLKKMRQSWSKKKITIGSQKQNTLATKEYRAMFIFICLFISIICCYNFVLLLYLWIIPVFCIALPIRSMIEIAEHFGCDTTTTDIFKNSRVIRGRLASWLTNGNNYHVVHHLYPHYPLSLTRTIYYKLKQPTQTVERSYILFYLRLFKKLYSKRLGFRGL